MKNVSVGAVVVVSLMAAACSFSTDSRPAPPPPGYRPPPPGYPQQYPQQPVAGSIGRQPPPPGYAPQPGSPQPGYAPSAVAPGVAAFREPINIAQIQSLVGRNPKACGFLEVAQGVWTRVDCHAYAPAQKSIDASSSLCAKSTGPTRVARFKVMNGWAVRKWCSRGISQ